MLLSLVMLSSFLLGTTSAQSSIPSYCYNPSGADCSWYANCLQKRHPCPENNYAMRYANYYCNKFGQDYSSFSSLGQKWVDSTRKCLQKMLVPFLDKTTSCKSIKTMAFDSHPCCYMAGSQCTSPGDNAISVCDISFKDWLKVFWTIKGTLNIFGKNAEIVGTVSNALKVIQGCTLGLLGDEIDHNDEIPVSRETMNRILDQARRGELRDDDMHVKALDEYLRR